LTGYNELDSIAPEVTKAFMEIINIDKPVLVVVDDHFIFVSFIITIIKHRHTRGYRKKYYLKNVL